MAQLRCAQTSELLAEGTPLEIATAAEAFPADEILFDDVGADPRTGQTRFDPAAVRKVRAGEIDGLERSLAELPARATADVDAETLKARRETLKATIAERRARIDAGQKLVAGAKRTRDEALKRRDERAAREG